MKHGIEDLEKLMEIQLRDGNWNYDEYMYGMTNGMILFLSLLKGEQLEFMDRPEKWKCTEPMGKVISGKL